MGLVRRIRAQLGTTVFLTTHYLDEADALADRIVVADAGAIGAEGSSAITGRTTAEEPIAI